jgi:DNA-binding NtrC family response regulator
VLGAQSATPAGADKASIAERASVLPNGARVGQKVDRPRLLLVDDEERILNALSALFRYKYQVFTSTNGDRALEILKDYHVHVVVSDQRMPAMTGIEFLRRAKVVSPKTVRILLTGFSDLSAVIDSVNDGEVYRFLNKPWGNQEIQAVIADAITIGVELESAEPGNRRSDARVPASVSDAANAPMSGQPAIVMMHDRRDRFEEIRPLLDDLHPFVYAKNVAACLDTLHERNVAVVVSDLQVGKGDCAELLKLLKREHPQILTIVLADSADAERVIELINQAKIFRYVLSPCKPQKLKFFIDSALMHFQRSLANPTLLRQQKVDVPSPVARSNASSLIVARLRALRGLLVTRSN